MALTLTARRERKKMRKIAVKRRMAEKGKKGKERRAEQIFRKGGKIKGKEEEREEKA